MPADTEFQAVKFRALLGQPSSLRYLYARIRIAWQRAYAGPLPICPEQRFSRWAAKMVLPKGNATLGTDVTGTKRLIGLDIT